ncbi:hypothetical protein C2S51_014373 [Perilla frutescens var. frutescens]|nr:hypothetical protein C2S51_014373 [Perilla frutescens var. frutescens]
MSDHLPLACRCSDGSVWNPNSNTVTTIKEEGTTLMVGNLNSRTRPYHSRMCKKASSTTNIESLPDELLSEIIVRVPTDDIRNRAGLVCRRWYHIIHSHAFVNTHLHHSTYGLLLSAYGLRNIRNPIYVTASKQGGIEISHEISCKRRNTAWGGFNGLILELDNYKSRGTKKTSLYVLNPATKQAFLLPPFNFDCNVVYGSWGITYNASSVEYKVVQSHITKRDTRLIHLVVLTVGVDNSWRPVQVEHLPRDARELLCLNPLITEGFMHWVAGSEKVLTLNLETEVIKETNAPLPEAYEGCRKCYMSTGRYLSLLVSCRKHWWEVWEMKPAESGEWKKQIYNIKFDAQQLQQFEYCNNCSSHGDEDLLRPVGWVKYPEVLAFGVQCSATLIFYSLPRYYGDYHVFPHRNTLLWLS